MYGDGLAMETPDAAQELRNRIPSTLIQGDYHQTSRAASAIRGTDFVPSIRRDARGVSYPPGEESRACPLRGAQS